jgi:hypothetical protein
MREAPDTSSEVITTVAAGEPLVILGRDLSGLWLLVATNDGFEGWIRITQFQGRIDVPRIPLADSIPTPAASPSPTSDLTITATTVVETAPDEILFEIQNDGKRVCQEFRWFLPGKLGVPSDSVDIRQYETTNAASIVGQKSFRFVRSAEIPTFIQFEVDGPMTATNCTNNECSSVDMTICGFAFADAVTGGFVYRSNVFFQFGTQSYTDFFTEIETRIPLGFTVEKAQ